MNTDVWLRKAALPKKKTNKNYPRKLALESIFDGDGAQIAADGHRIHYWFDEGVSQDAEQDSLFPFSSSMAHNETGREGKELCEFSTYSLKKACTVALSFTKKQYAGDYVPEGSEYLYVHINSERMELVAGRKEVGSMTYTLSNGDTWKLKKSKHNLFYNFKADAPDHFYVNPKYLKQALEGMGKSAVLRRSGDMLHLTGESGAEAVIMLLRFDSYIKEHAPRVLESDIG